MVPRYAYRTAVLALAATAAQPAATSRSLCFAHHTYTAVAYCISSERVFEICVERMFPTSFFMLHGQGEFARAVIFPNYRGYPAVTYVVSKSRLEWQTNVDEGACAAVLGTSASGPLADHGNAKPREATRSPSTGLTGPPTFTAMYPKVLRLLGWLV